jgi:predicted RNase H-like HicB family nuclease
MVRSIVHKGECYNISINVLMPGAGGTTATCRECPELLELGDDPDDALRRIREAIERRTK